MIEFMKDYVCEKDVSFSVKSAGDGCWGMKAGILVRFYKIRLTVSAFSPSINGSGMCFTAHLSFYHLNDSREYGLPYTDTGIQNGIRREIHKICDICDIINAETISGSEHGMQDHFLFDCDVDLKNAPDLNKLEESGYRIIDYI